MKVNCLVVRATEVLFGHALELHLNVKVLINVVILQQAVVFSQCLNVTADVFCIKKNEKKNYLLRSRFNYLIIQL